MLSTHIVMTLPVPSSLQRVDPSLSSCMVTMLPFGSNSTRATKTHGGFHGTSINIYSKHQNKQAIKKYLVINFIISILKLLVIPAIWLALSSVIYSQITLFFAPNHICSKSHHSCSKSRHFCFKSNWMLRFQNGYNKVVIELRVKQFWSEFILVISNRTSAQILKSRVWFQTKLHSTQFNYHYKLCHKGI